MAQPVPPSTSDSVDQWIAFLQRAFESRSVAPPYGTHDLELHQGLINVHRSISAAGARHAYDDAVAALFDSYSASPHLTWELFTLLQVVAYAKPVNAKQLVRRAAVAEVFRHRCYGGYDLHALALAAASKYAIDDFLLEYIDRSARLTSDLRYLLTCFRIRSTADSPKGIAMLLHLVGAVHNDGDLQMIIRELRGYTGLYGCKPLLDWYLENQAIGAADAEHWAGFEELLLSHVTGPTLVTDGADDPHRVALAAALLSVRQPLLPSDYAAVAFATVPNADRATRALEFIWKSQAARGWRVYVLGPDEYDKADERPDDAILLFHRGGDRVYISLTNYPAAANTLLRLEQASRSRPRNVRAV